PEIRHNITPAETPYAAEFPGATHAQTATIDEEDGSGVGYAYFRISADSLFSLGFVFHQLTPTDTTYFEYRTELNAVFPLALGTTIAKRDSFPHDWDDGYSIENTVETFNAYGFLHFQGQKYPVLRSIDHRQDSSYSNQEWYLEQSVRFFWISRDGLVMDARMNGVFPAFGVVWVDDIEVTSIVPTSLVGVSDEPVPVPVTFALKQNYPNPFNPSTTISFDLPSAGRATLRVYNLLGQEIATLLDEDRPAGTYAVTFNAGHLPSGIYFYQIVTEGGVRETKKMVLMK
ncbi:MAG: T9SS type A sorting domain-containing protein, partial [Bacteroidota bacterium]